MDSDQKSIDDMTRKNVKRRRVGEGSSTDTVDEGTGNQRQALPTVESQLSPHHATCTVKEAIARVHTQEEGLKKRFCKWQTDGNSSSFGYGLHSRFSFATS